MSSDAMTKVTVRIPRQQLGAIGDLVDEGRYATQSEAIRAAIRELCQERRDDRTPPGSYLPRESIDVEPDLKTDGGTERVDPGAPHQYHHLAKVAGFDGDTWSRVQRAADEAECDDAAEFVREATRRLINEVLDEGGRLECPHDDCDRTFATIRERRGHLGSSEHALDVPDGEFWCGYCGYGPTSWRGINAHHGSSTHDGDPVRLDEAPDRDDLLAPDDVPDHKNPELLERLYRKHDGNYTEMCRQHDFDVSPGRVRHYLIEFGIHDVTPHGAADEGGPRHRDPEWLEDEYEAAGGNVSEMHRDIDHAVPYRTLLKNLKRFGIHDATDPPGKRHGKGGPPSAADTGIDDDPDNNPFAELDTPVWLDENTFRDAVDGATSIPGLADELDHHQLGQLERFVDELDLWEDLQETEGGRDA